MKHTIHKFGDNINTDLIIASRHLTNFLSEEELGTHVFENLDPNFAKTVRKGDVLVVGKNFGCGSSREEAVIALAACGLYAIVAESFSRTFFRNCINRGALSIVECEGISEASCDGDEIDLDLSTGTVILSDGTVMHGTVQPDFVKEIIADGGLLEHIAAQKRKAVE